MAARIQMHVDPTDAGGNAVAAVVIRNGVAELNPIFTLEVVSTNNAIAEVVPNFTIDPVTLIFTFPVIVKATGITRFQATLKLSKGLKLTVISALSPTTAVTATGTG